MTKIIAITGKKHHGKTEVRNYLNSHYGYTAIAFADPLKHMLRSIGLTYEQLWGSDKEIPLELLGRKRPRQAMQTLGTEWGRELIHYDLWVNVWVEKVKRENQPRVVVDDLRFLNEEAAIKRLGGSIIKIERPNKAKISDIHQSETEMEEIKYDFKIINDGSIFMLKSSIHKVMEKING